MCHTRDILRGFETFFYGSDQLKQPIQKVKPRQALLICPMICEITAAEIRNTTVDSMRKNDISDVAYRFLQSRRGENNTFYEILFWGTNSFLLYKFACFHPMMYVALLCYLPHIPPNVGNTLRYKETKNYCAEWLVQKLGNEKFGEIKKLKFNREGMFQLSALLKKENIDVTHLESKNTKDDRLRCCNRDR